MVYLLNMVMFYSYVTNHQRVAIFGIEGYQGFQWIDSHLVISCVFFSGQDVRPGTHSCRSFGTSVFGEFGEFHLDQFFFDPRNVGLVSQ